MRKLLKKSSRSLGFPQFCCINPLPPSKFAQTTSQVIFLHVREAASGIPSPSWNQSLHPPMNALKPHLLERITHPLRPSLGLARWRAVTGDYCGLVRWPPLSINVFVIICWVRAFHSAGEGRTGAGRASGGGVMFRVRIREYGEWAELHSLITVAPFC